MPGLAEIQALKDVESWLTSDWNNANTDSITPKIVLDVEVTESMLNTSDHVLVIPVTEIIRPFGIHGDDWRHDVPLTVQCRTKKRVSGASYLDHLQKMGSEAMRIIKARVRQAGYAMVVPTGARSHNEGPHDPFILDIMLTITKINPP